MLMKSYFYVVVLFLISTLSLSAQNQLEELLKEGLAFQQEGKYDQAIERYKKMLDLDPHSSSGHYEIAKSYMYQGNYDLAIEHSQRTIDLGGRLVIPAVVVKASSLSNLNQVEEAIALLEDAVENRNADAMVYYNLAIAYKKVKKIEEAEQALHSGIYENPMHASSHFMLALMQAEKGKRTEAMLAGYFFLLLETNTARTIKMEQLIKSLYTAGVAEGESAKKKKNVNLTLTRQAMASKFLTVEMALSLSAATAISETNTTKGDAFYANTTRFLELISEVKRPAEQVEHDLEWNFYVPFFSELYQKKHSDVFCNYISQMKPGGNRRWIDRHIDQVRIFEQWVVDKSRELIGIEIE
ncbi:tetratricopeptide repeat protein [Myroides sp. DF42-4-2]|uniref:tetratricopeptide repeat protein n=1 Tax=unclassified Myroides TaxID=2642485 RepID=UPI0025780929|nr:tetratricopeptide repeat protein [Myroides sp. DF42-4-2]MDM1408451.1 tetratricopeptide repeat protein [Myroides sp. DF42-4-2]